MRSCARPMPSIIAAFKRWGISLVIPAFLDVNHPRHERDFCAFIRLCLVNPPLDFFIRVNRPSLEFLIYVFIIIFPEKIAKQ